MSSILNNSDIRPRRAPLPCDVEEDIFLRVPIKTLVRFRQVCRGWNTLFHDPRFVQKHLSSHRYSHQGFVLWDSYFNSIMYTDVATHHYIEYRDSSIKLYDEFSKVRSRILQMIHCDGLLLCLAEHGIRVLNPCLRQERLIQTVEDWRKFTFRLGYDKNNASYKILKFQADNDERPNHLYTEIYDFTSSAWRVLTHLSRFDWYVRRTAPCTSHSCTASLNGTPYWFALRKPARNCFIQSFDFSEERFEPLCDIPFRYNEKDSYGLSVFRGERLSALRQSSRTKVVEIWVTSKIGDGAEVSWIKFANFANIFYLLDQVTYFFDDHDNTIIFDSSSSYNSVGIFIARKDGIIRSYSKCCPFHVRLFACNYFPTLVRVS